MLKAISKRQSVLKDALAANHSYPLLSRGDKNAFDNFAQMSKIFENQEKQAKLSSSLAEHIITLYNKFLDKLQELYMTLSEFNFDSQDEHGLMQSCPSLEWCKRVQDQLANVLEFPFHQQFFNKVLFADPRNKFDYSLFEDHLNDASGADDTVIAANSTTLTSLRMTGNDILQPNAYEAFLTFNAYGSSVGSTSTINPVSTTTVNLSHKAMKCRTVMNVLTEEWIISNLDNSLPGILMRYYATSEHPTSFIWKLFDTNYFCEALASSMDESSDLSGTFYTGGASDHLLLFMQVIVNWIRGVERNLMEVEKQKIIIDNILETTCYNMKIVNEQLEILGDINEDELLAQIEHGNTTKNNLNKIPSVGTKPIFDAHEIKDFLKSCK